MDKEPKKIKVLLVDDSPIVRTLMTELLAQADPHIEVVGEAANGQEGVRLALALRPDLIIMDIQMPVMNGLVAIETIMKDNPTPILVVTSYSNANMAYDAIRRGALEVIEKPSIDADHCRQFVRKIKLLAGVKVIRHIRGNKPVKSCTFTAGQPMKICSQVVAIASSLGGANVLEAILSRLPADFPLPIVIAQHISCGFAEALAEWLNYKTPLTVQVAAQSELLTPGRVLVAPPEYNVQVDGEGRIALSPYLPGHIYHPSCDSLLVSVAKVFREGAIGIILTGMGQDGVGGIAAIKTAGGVTIAQNEQTSLIYNMPRLVVERGLADFVVAAEDITATLLRVVHK